MGDGLVYKSAGFSGDGSPVVDDATRCDRQPRVGHDDSRRVVAQEQELGDAIVDDGAAIHNHARRPTEALEDLAPRAPEEACDARRHGLLRWFV